MSYIFRLSAVILVLAATATAFAKVPLTKWAFQTDGPIRGSAVASADQILFGSADGFLYSVAQDDGILRWKFQTGGAIAGAPAVTDSAVIVAGRGRAVHALNLEDGSLLWSFEMQADLPIATSWNFFTAAPVVDGDQVLVGSGDGFLYALDLATGRQRWKFLTGDSIRAAPLVVDETVYLASGDDYVYALSSSDGSLHWKFATDGVDYDLSEGFIRSDIFTQPSLRNGLLVFGSRDSKVYAIDVNTHEMKWSFTYDSTWAMATAVDADTVYVGWSTNNMICALDLATGEKKWEFKAEAHNYAKPLLDGDQVIFGSASGNLYSFDKRDGQRGWTYRVGSEVYSGPIRSGDTYYFGADDGRLRAVTSSPPARKAVYLPEGIPENISGFVIDSALAPYLAERGFELLDSAEALAGWVSARLTDRVPSVVVFGFAQIPAAVVGAEPGSGPLRAYLETGGKVVWPWGTPNLVTFDAAGEFLAYDPTVADRLLDLEFVGFEDSGNYYGRPTQAGRNWGLPVWLKTSFASLKPGADVVPLIIDEYGRVSAFVKSFHPRPGSGWVVFAPSGFGVPMLESELALVERVASYTLD